MNYKEENDEINRQEKLLDTLPEAVVTVNDRAEIVFWNDGAEKIFGYSFEEVKGEPITILMPEEDKEKFLDSFSKLNPQKEFSKTIFHENQPKTKEGSSLKVEWSVTQHKLEGGTVWTGTGREVSERRKTRDKLRALEKASREMKLKKDREGIYELAMDIAKNILNYHNCAALELKADHLEIIKERGYKSFVLGNKIPLQKETITTTSAKKTRPVYVPDIEEDDRYLEGAIEGGCEYAIPLNVGEEFFGIFNVEDDQINSISVTDRNLLQILASEISVALMGLERLREVRRSQKKTKKLHRSIDLFEGCQSKKEVCDTAARVAEEILDLDLTEISLREGEYLKTVATSEELDKEEVGDFKIDEGTVGKTYRSGKTIVGNLGEMEEADPVNKRFKKIISTPLGQFGVLQVVYSEKDTFSEKDVEFVELLANQTRLELKRITLQQELKEQAVKDPLTGLYNRRYFKEKINSEIERARRHELAIGLLMIDLNKFKLINDQYSHQTGDKVLRNLAEILEKNTRKSDIVIRYGGDEFLIVFPQVEKDLEQTEKRISRKIQNWSGKTKLIDFDLKAAMGSYLFEPGNNENLEDALKIADRRMYEDKKEKRN